MDVGFHSPLLDFFKRGEVAKDVRILAAQGALAPRAYEQVALLAILTDDGDPDVRSAAEATLAAIPTDSLAMFLGRSDVSDSLRDFFRARGVEPVAGGEADDAPLVDTEGKEGEGATDQPSEERDDQPERQSTTARLALLGVAGRMKAAMKGTKEERAILIRDPNKLVSVSVLSSPKITESEVENFAKMASVSEEILRIIGHNRAWTKNYGVIAGLAKNPKTPLAVTLHLVQRLNDRDLKSIVMDRNLQEPLKRAARKRVTEPGRK